MALRFVVSHISVRGNADGTKSLHAVGVLLVASEPSSGREGRPSLGEQDKGQGWGLPFGLKMYPSLESFCLVFPLLSTLPKREFVHLLSSDLSMRLPAVQGWLPQEQPGPVLLLWDPAAGLSL